MSWVGEVLFLIKRKKNGARVVNEWMSGEIKQGLEQNWVWNRAHTLMGPGCWKCGTYEDEAREMRKKKRKRKRKIAIHWCIYFLILPVTISLFMQIQLSLMTN